MLVSIARKACSDRCINLSYLLRSLHKSIIFVNAMLLHFNRVGCHAKQSPRTQNETTHFLIIN